MYTTLILFTCQFLRKKEANIEVKSSDLKNRGAGRNAEKKVEQNTQLVHPLGQTGRVVECRFTIKSKRKKRTKKH
jgi:hypothetical protein